MTVEQPRRVPTEPVVRAATWEESQRHSGAGEVHAALGSAVDYIKQVYALVTASLLLSVAAGYVGMTSAFAWEHPWILMGIQFGTLFLAIYKRNTPTLFLFTGVTGFAVGPLIGMFVSAGLSALVGNAVLLTALVFGGATVYAFTTKRDLSLMGGMLFAGLMVLVVGSLLNGFLLESSAMAMGLAAMGTLIFTGYLVYETQQLKRHPWVQPPAVAALGLYLNILNLFLSLLRLLAMLAGEE